MTIYINMQNKNQARSERETKNNKQNRTPYFTLRMKAKKEEFIFRSRARDYRFFAADQSRGTKKSC